MPTKKMTKPELVRHIAAHLQIPSAQVKQLLEELCWLSERELKKSGEFSLPGLVKLVMRKRKPREGRNPITGAPVPILARTVVTARIAKLLKLSVLASLDRPVSAPVVSAESESSAAGQR